MTEIKPQESKNAADNVRLNCARLVIEELGYIALDRDIVNDLLGSVAEGPLEGRVDVLNGPLGIGHDNGVPSLLDGRHQKLAFSEAILPLSSSMVRRCRLSPFVSGMIIAHYRRGLFPAIGNVDKGDERSKA